MKKNFYIVSCPKEEFNLLFHQPTSNIAKIDKNIQEADLNVEALNLKVSNKSFVSPNKDLEYGKGKITLTFMSARTCNLGCTYCFADKGEYGDSSTKPKYITYNLYMKALSKALLMYPEGIKRVGFFGGEPLLNFHEFKLFIPDCLEVFRKEGLDSPIFSLTTNLTLLTSEMIDFFKEYNIFINVSLDGEGEINDIARKYKKGNASVYNTVLKKCRMLEDKGVLYSIEATINQNHIKEFESGDAIQWIQGIERLNFNNIVIVPVETNISSLSIKTPKELDNLILFTKELVNYYINKVVSGNIYKLSPYMILPVIQIIKKSYLRSCTSGQSFFCDTDGNLYPCHMFCNDSNYHLGNLDEGINIPMSEEVANTNKEKCEDCNKCIARNICAIWCKGLQYLYNNDMLRVSETRCIFQRAIFEECLITLADKEKREKFLCNYKSYRNPMDAHENIGEKIG